MNKYEYKYSIIIGTYNHASTIAKLAEALNQQTVQDFEILLCDDGSNDGTQDVFESSLHPILKKRYRYFRQPQKGMRLAKNVNQGIKAAKGEYCVFVMGDSFPDPYYLEVFDQFAQPHRMLCGVRYQVDNGVGVDIDWRLKKKAIPPENAVIPKYPFRCGTGNGLVIPTEALKQYGGWDERLEGYGGDDYDIICRLYYKGYIFYSLVDAKLYHNWHKAKESNPESLHIIQQNLIKYAGFKEVLNNLN